MSEIQQVPHLLSLDVFLQAENAPKPLSGLDSHFTAGELTTLPLAGRGHLARRFWHLPAQILGYATVLAEIVNMYFVR